MEFRDGFKQSVRGEIRQKILEPSKGQGTLVKILSCFRGIQTKAAHIVIHSPELSLIILIIEQTVISRDKMQSHSGIVHPLTDEIRNRLGIGHQLDGFAEHIGVDPLKHIFMSCVGGDFEGGVDVTAAEFNAANGLTLQNKGAGSRLNCHIAHLKTRIQEPA